MMRVRHRRGERPSAATRLADRDLATTWQLASLLLEYPTLELAARLPLLRSAVASLPAAVGDRLAEYLDVLASTDLGELQRDYVDTFDVTRRCALHLTYFTLGDTRRRGVALVELKQAYRRAGAELSTDELPDFLPVVLEFGASADLQGAHRILVRNRVGLEMLRLALDQRGSRWLPVVDAVRMTLPALDGEGAQAIRRLLEQGPPREDVGLDTSPYALDPRLNPQPEPYDASIVVEALS